MVVSAPVLELEADVLERMQDYVAQLAAGFERITRHYWAGVYLHGLMLDGERKSIQPLAERVTVPGWHGDTMQALQHFISDSTWDEQAVLQVYRRLLAASLADAAGVIVIDDTGFAKKGRHSAGVARAVLRHPGQDGQLPGGGLAALRRSQRRLPAGTAPVSAGDVDEPGGANAGG